jgi:hypothetical protein
VTKVVVGPETAAAEEQEFLGIQTAQDAFVNDLAVLVGMDDVHRLTNVEPGETVDGNIGEQLEDIRPSEPAFPQKRPVADVTRLFPRHALIDPVGIFGQAPTHREISGRR